VNDFVYRNVFQEAQKMFGTKTIYVDSDTQGHFDYPRLAEEIPDYKERIFYISGSHGVVSAFENILRKLQILGSQIVTDYFPGFA
jgi:ferredoxin-NADP reductase